MTLVETLISAVILIIVLGAVLTTIDASGRTTSVNKNRSIAATLAEQDQERMRALTPTALDNHSRTAPMVVGGVTYTVDSRAEWVLDATGATQSCENASGQASYIRISSTVTSSVVGTRVKPVTMRSIVAPRVESFPEDSGTLTVKVTDQLNQPVVGKQVSIAPAATTPRVTNAFGCAVFSHIPVGAYTATINEPGWVNEQRQQQYDVNANVQLDRTTNVAMTYAPAAYIAVTLKTDQGSGPLGSNAHAVTVSNAKSGDLTTAAAVTTPVPAITVGPLFPYPDGYTAYSGRCGLNDPADPSYSPANDAYVATQPGFTNVTPGGTVPVDVHQPSVNLKVVNGSGVAVTGANIVFTQASATTCGSTSPTARFRRTTGSDGYALPDRGLPFGKYTACADRNVAGTNRFKLGSGTIDNTKPGGSTPVPNTITVTGSDSAGTCP